ncbi:hypothetical protein [Streptomyces sp. NPDC004788]
MGKWAVVAQDVSGADAKLVTEMTGSRAEAEAALRRFALTYHKPMREKRRWVYRLGEDRCLVRVMGLVGITDTVLSLAELVYDSADPDAAYPAWPAGTATPEDRPPAR